jgi:HlyD family secretion protein
MKKTIIVLVILGLAGLGAFRVAQVISAKKEDAKNARRNLVPQVEIAPVTQGRVEEKITRTGDIVPYSQVTINSKVQGWVEKILVREGDPVKAGQILVVLDDREARAAVGQSLANVEAAQARLKQVRAISEEAVQSQVQQARANLELAESDLKRARELHGKNFIARQQLDEAQTRYNVAKAAYDLAQNNLRQRTWENEIALAEAQLRQAQAQLDLAQAQLANLTIHSPMDGMVTKRHVDPGAMVRDVSPILTLMDVNVVKMMVNVIEKEFVLLRREQPVKVTVTAFPQKVFDGRIEIITPALELQSRTAEIQISIPNPGGLLKPGMFGRAEITLRSNPQALIIPVMALQTQIDEHFVFVVKDNKAVRRPVRKGAVLDEFAEILQGLNLHDQVVVTGQDALKDGSPVRPVVKDRPKPS